MLYYRRNAPNPVAPESATRTAADALRQATVTTRRLLPLSGMDDGSNAATSLTDATLSSLATPPTSLATPLTSLAPAELASSPLPPMTTPLPYVAPPLPSAAADAARAGGASGPLAGQAATLLPRAAGILNEEMARGALDAAAMPPIYGLPQGLPALPGYGDDGLLKDLYAFAQRFAALMPSGTRSAPAAGGLPELHTRDAAVPGQAVQLRMQLHNDEAQALTLRPVATALIGDGGAQVAVEQIGFSQSEVQLPPGTHTELVITISLPAHCAPGYYTGLLVLTGRQGLRALMCVDVTRR